MPEGAPARGPSIGIVLADDHPLIRGGLRRVLEWEVDLTVVGEAADVEGALDLTRAHQPRVVVLDLNMPGRPTLPAIPEFLDAAPGCVVLVLTMEAEPAFARQALAAGARGYVLKEAAEAELVDAIRAILAGRTYLDPSLGARLAQMGSDPGGRIPSPFHGDPQRAIGSDFAGHRIDGFLGRGGMGLVFRATDLTLQRPVALKLIASEVAEDPGFRARFERECRMAASIDHPHVVEVFHAGEENGLMYVTMRYIDGTDLLKMLRTETRLEPARAVSIGTQIAGALHEAHSLGLVHRDVKPSNVLLAARSGREHAFLTDFGITKRAGDQPLTRTGVALGSVDYMAPEQAHGGDVDARADIYSLGCVLYQMLSGRVVFERDSEMQTLWAHVHDPPPRLAAELPPGLQRVLDRALAKRVDDRQQTAAEFSEQVAEALRT